MSEKIAHTTSDGKAKGHPGIDFVFSSFGEDAPAYIVAMDGTVATVSIYSNPEIVEGSKTPLSEKVSDVVIRNGIYQTKYSQMDTATLPATIKQGAKVKQGDIIGWGSFATDPLRPGMRTEMIHFEFGSTFSRIGRFCPLQYFTQDSLARINQVWMLTIWNGKDQYPKICNGIYEGKFEK